MQKEHQIRVTVIGWQEEAKQGGLLIFLAVILDSVEQFFACLLYQWFQSKFFGHMFKYKRWKFLHSALLWRCFW